MRTTFKPQLNPLLVRPTQQVLYILLDEMNLSEYSGKRCVSKAEIKHIHLNYALVSQSISNN